MSAHTRRPLLAFGCAGALIASLFAVFVVAAAVRNSVLTTPSTSIPVDKITIAGAAFGALFGATADMWLPTKPWVNRWVNLFWATPTFALLEGAVCDQLAWDAADALAFRGSTAPIVLTTFPIRSYGEGRGGPYAYTGGRGPATGHAISVADYDILAAAGRLRRPWRYCLPLYRQQEGSAVRVFLSRRIALSETRRLVTIVECPRYVQQA